MKKDRHKRKEGRYIVYEALLTLKTMDDCERFLDDLLTPQELEKIIQRFQIAVCLDEGKTYKDIQKITGASTVTISRVNQSLLYGNDGYKNVLNKLNKLT